MAPERIMEWELLHMHDVAMNEPLIEAAVEEDDDKSENGDTNLHSVDTFKDRSDLRILPKRRLPVQSQAPCISKRLCHWRHGPHHSTRLTASSLAIR
jgi:hypothetical protein